MRLVIVFIIHIFSFFVFAGEITFETLTSVDGLSQNNVLDIYKDSDGYIWFATYDGLNRYDGYEFYVFTGTDNKKSLSGNIINHIAEDHNKNIWVGTLDKGVNKLNKNTEEITHYINTPDSPNILTGNTVTKIFCDSKKRLWVCTATGINCFIPQPNESYHIKKFTHDKNIPASLYNDNIGSITEDSQERIWVSTRQSLDLMIDSEKGEIQNSFHHFLTDSTYFDIRTMLQVPDGYLVTHHKGATLLKFKNDVLNEPELIHLEDHSSYNMVLDNNGNVWAGGHNGLYLFEYYPNDNPPYKITRHITEGETKNTLHNQFIRSMLFDDSGILWLGTHGGGALKYNTRKTQFRHYKSTGIPGSLSHSKVTSFYEDNQHNIWIGTEGGGLNLLTSNKEKDYNNGFIHIDVNPPEQQNFIFDIIQLSNSKTPVYWAGAGYNAKLVSIQKENGSWTSKAILPALTHHVITIYKDEFGTIWMGTFYGGLWKYTQTAPNKKLINYNLKNSAIPANIISNITEDTKGRLWIATSEGVMLLNREQKKEDTLNFTLFQNNPNDSCSIGKNYTAPITETSDSDIWIGTYGAGLYHYIEGSTSANGSFEKYDIQSGLPNNTIRQIIEDDEGILWITTNKGLSQFNRNTLEFRNFDVNDGLQDVEFTDVAGCKLHDGEILIGGNNGFNAFYPNEIFKDTIPPKLVFTELELFNKPIGIGEIVNNRVLLNNSLNSLNEITLQYKENDFTIHFAGLHYTSPKKNCYEYTLVGFDQKWHHVKSDRRFSKYTNLHPGKYIFKFKATNSDGIWEENARSINIIIKPPIWATWWFRILAAVLCITSAILIFYMRIRQIRMRNICLETEVNERTQEIQNKNNELNRKAIELNETNTTLEERQQKIEELAEELTAQRDQLYQANSVKDRLFSIIAHDLKTPVNTLNGFLQILVQRYNKHTDEKRKSLLNYALFSAGNIQNLLINLFSWAQAQRGEIQFNPNKINIVTVIKEVISHVSIQSNGKDITLKLTTSQPEIMINADSDLLNIVIRNLLTNAIKFTNPFGIIEVKCQKSDNSVSIAVIDDGVGISKENQKKIFRQEEHITTYGTSEEKGSGLGLITCKDFVELHNGTITIDSSEGEGTTFTINLPLNQN